MISLLYKMLCRLASLWLTLVCLLVAATIALAGQFASAEIGVWIAVPFAMLGINLLAALAVTPKLRRQAGLLGFHLALAGLAVLAAVDQMIALRGHVEITEGTAFDDHMVVAEAGPFHPWRLDRVRFVQAGFEIDYAPQMKRGETRSTVLLPESGGRWRKAVVGDDDPVVIGDYRFYTSFNKGFAPVLTYMDARGIPHTGAVHLPSYPLNYYKQGNAWRLPDGAGEVKLWLNIPEPVYDPAKPWHFGKPDDAVLVVMDGEGRHELRPGESIPVGAGSLRYDELRGWMGYTIAYNPLTPWMLGAVAVAMLCLGWHVVVRFRRVPWQAVGTRRELSDVG